MQKITLTAWAAMHYDPPPTAWVLRQWVRRGEIVPAPERVGRDLYVPANARRITAQAAPVSLVERLKQA